MKLHGSIGVRTARGRSFAIALGCLLLLASCRRNSTIEEDVSGFLPQAEIDRIASCGHDWIRGAKTVGLNSRHLLMWAPDRADVILVADVPAHSNQQAKWFIAHDSDHDGVSDDIDLIWWRDGDLCSFSIKFGGKDNSRGPAIMLSMGDRSWVDAGRYD